MRQRALWAVVLLMSCDVNGSARWTLGGGPRSSSPPAAPAPTAAPAETVAEAPSSPAAPSKRGSKVSGPQVDEVQVTAIADPRPRPRATSALDGQYLIWPDSGCGAATVKLTGPDVQTAFEKAPNRIDGFICPATCDHPMPVTVKNGVASLIVVWHHNESLDEGYNVTHERFKVEIPLFKDPPLGAKGETFSGFYRGKMTPKTWTDRDGYDHRSNSFGVGISVSRTDDETYGHGKSGWMIVSTGKDDKYFVDEDNRLPNCGSTFGQKNFRFPAPADEGGGDDDSPASSPDRTSSRDDARAATAKRKCRAQCKLDAGECRKGSSGAKAANACNKAERSCESSC